MASLPSRPTSLVLSNRKKLFSMRDVEIVIYGCGKLLAVFRLSPFHGEFYDSCEVRMTKDAGKIMSLT